MGTGAIVSNAQNPDIKEYTDVHGNKVIEFLNPVDPGNEPAAAPEDHPDDLGQVQGDVMMIEAPTVSTPEAATPEVTTPSEDLAGVPVTLPLDEETIYTDESSVEKNDVKYVSDDVITYTDAYGNKVTEFLNPVDPGNEPATMPDYVPSTEGNIQGDIMTLDEPIMY